MTTSNINEDSEKQDYSCIAGKNVEWCNLSGRKSGHFLKTKHTTNIQPSNYTPGHLPQRNETSVHIKTCTGVLTVVLLKQAKSGTNPEIFQWVSD